MGICIRRGISRRKISDLRFVFPALLVLAIGCGGGKSMPSSSSSLPAKVIFIGDSITQLWSWFGNQLPYPNAVNAGIGGQKVAQIAARFDTDVIQQHPDLVVIMAGTNDLIQTNEPPDQLAALFQQMVSAAVANNIKVVVESLPPIDCAKAQQSGFVLGSDCNPQTIEYYNSLLQNVAMQNGAAFADYFSAMSSSDGLPLPGLMKDGVHPTPQGYAVMDSVVTVSVDGVLNP